MTEEQWLSCDDPEVMLAFLRGRAGDRKLRLFACACCRRISTFLLEKRSVRLIELSEQYADGEVTGKRLRTAWEKAEEAKDDVHLSGGGNVDQDSAEAVLGLGDPLDLAEVTENAAETMGDAARNAAYERVWKTPGKGHHERERADEAAYLEGATKEEAAQAAILREIVGNPFREIALVPAWLADQDRTAVKLAQGIYTDRAFDRLPILADALEDAGCADHELLGHLRSVGPHVRGCWALDLVLGKL